MSVPVWFGTTAAVTQSILSYEDTEERGVIELNWKGDWNAIRTLAAAYPINSSIAGYNGLVKVNRSYRDTPTGSIGSLQVQIVSPWLLPIPEIDWVEKQVDYGRNAFYSGHVLIKDYTNIEQLLNDPDNTAACSGVTANTWAKNLYEKYVAKGRTYPVYCPVARQTDYYYSQPTTGGCGRRTAAPSWAPTFDLNSATFFYVKTADRAIKQLTLWQRQQEWTGYTAELFDGDITPGP